MFRKNQGHLQPAIISNVQQLPERQRQRLEQSWAGTFYREVFSRLNEGPFAVMYADIPSRPNVPVNLLVGLEYLKSGFGWSDEELYDAFLYNIQVRYALGYSELGEGEFDLRTLYYFRERLNRHMQETGVNLLGQAFEQVTDEQVAAFKLKTGLQRMDTTQVSSNIREWGRLHLLVVVLQRVYRMLLETEQASYREKFIPYVKEDAGHYLYRLRKGDFLAHLQKIGDFMDQLLSDLKEMYHEHPTYQILERVFKEHYRVEAQGIQGRSDHELSPHRLLSPDDPEATLRGRRNTVYQGYVANITETCDPQNPVQLITKIQTASNNIDDPKLLLEALPNLKQRTDLETLYTDGGFGSYAVDRAFQEQHVEQVATGIRGRQPSSEKLTLFDFEFETDETNHPIQVRCPQGQSVPVKQGTLNKNFAARFDLAICSQCPFGQSGHCPAKPVRKNPTRHLYFTEKEFWSSKRRKQVQMARKEKGNLRAAIEATCRAIKCRFPKSKFPVRGKFRMNCMLIGSAVLNNVRQINRYLLAT